MFPRYLHFTEFNQLKQSTCFYRLHITWLELSGDL